MFTFLSRPPPEECVYNLLEQTVDDQARGPPIYRSRFACVVRQESKCNKTGCFKTMGVPRTCLCPPQNYLKKHSRAPITIKSSAPRIKVTTEKPSKNSCECPCPPPPAEECCPEAPQDDACNMPEASDCAPRQPKCCDPNELIQELPTCCDPRCPHQPTPSGKCRIPRICCNRLRPPVPNRMVCKVCPEDARNYIHSNVVKALRMPPKKPFPRFVFHPKGHTRNFEESGYPRKYVYKDTFGCVPAYIQAIKMELRGDDCQAKYDMKYKERDIESQVRHLESVEHQAILCGLKTNWAEKFAEFQSLPLLVDTMAKVNKKKELEDELKKLEADIQLLERHDHVFVSDTCRSFYLA